VADEAIENSQAQWFWRMLSSTVVTARANEISSSGVVEKPRTARDSFIRDNNGKQYGKAGRRGRRRGGNGS
jgi:hypothetical protein